MELIEILEKTRKFSYEYRDCVNRFKAAKIEFERLKQEMSDYNLEDKKIHEEHLSEISKYREKVLSLVERSEE